MAWKENIYRRGFRPSFPIVDLRKEAIRNNAEFIKIVEAGHMSHVENTDVAIKVFEKVIEI